MDLKNLTPKDKDLYKIAMERKETFIDDFCEIIQMISRAEYKRGKADGIAETTAFKPKGKTKHSQGYIKAKKGLKELQKYRP